MESTGPGAAARGRRLRCIRPLWVGLAATFPLIVVATPVAAVQVFYLDFDTLAGPLPHDYTPEQRDAIAAAMGELYAPLGVQVTHEPPGAGVFASTIFFNAVAAGTSDGIDFRNVSKTDSARLNARQMLEIVGIEAGDQTPEQIVRASINTAMHESLHLLGARHQDAFTLPGGGVSTQGIAERYWPTYPGPRQAAFTASTFMSLSHGAFGLSEQKLLNDELFISPRSALKALVGEAVSPASQLPGINSPFTAQHLPTTSFALPNTMPDLPLPPELAPFLPEGISPEAITARQLQLGAEVAIVAGTITQAEIDDVDISPSHYYAVPIIPGMPYTIESFSEVLDHRTGFTPFDSALSVIVADSDSPSGLSLHPYYGTLGFDGFNRDSFEGFDPAMVDVIAPGAPHAIMIEDQPHMLVEVWAQAGFGQQPAPGDYEMIIYTISITGIDLLLGDMNVDGVVDTGDVAPFVLALTDEQAYIDQYGLDPALVGDINQDGSFDTGDVAPFVQLLIGGDSQSVPEPCSLALLGLGGLLLLRRGPRGARFWENGGDRRGRCQWRQVPTWAYGGGRTSCT